MDFIQTVKTRAYQRRKRRTNNEKIRRSAINDGFMSLQDVLRDHATDQDLSRPNLLIEAVKKVQELQSKVQQAKAEHQAALERNAYLKRISTMTKKVQWRNAKIPINRV